jgi:hydroxymethylbilane synthase
VTLKLGTRGSALALVQARAVAARLTANGVPTELVTITTTGDRLQHAPLTDAGGKRLFVKEIEDALARGEIDLAVHSAKDMPAALQDGLDVAAVLPREDPRDALVLPQPFDRAQGQPFDRAQDKPADLREALAHLGETPVIGTGSVRRIAQLTTLFPQALFKPIRGNVDTRVRKLDAGEFTALVLAAAGLRRLGLPERISATLPYEHSVPAPGQGIIAIETRAGDETTRQALAPLNDAQTLVSLTAERAVVAALGGGCQLPLGALAVHEHAMLRDYGVVASTDGDRLIRREVSGSPAAASDLGRRLADDLVTAGAREILDEVRARQ